MSLFGFLKAGKPEPVTGGAQDAWNSRIGLEEYPEDEILIGRHYASRYDGQSGASEGVASVGSDAGSVEERVQDDNR